jgi:putative transposase
MPQSLANVIVHAVFSTKHRSPTIVGEARPRLHEYVGGILRGIDCPPIQVGGVEDHIHILLRLNRTVTIAQTIEKVKTSSSKWMKEFSHEFAWQNGYGVFSLSQSDLDAAITYVQRQAEHHHVLTFQDEFRDLMRQHGLSIDERYVWD